MEDLVLFVYWLVILGLRVAKDLIRSLLVY